MAFVLSVLGAKITPEQKKILENHGMVFIENMRNPKTRQLFSDDVRFSNKAGKIHHERIEANSF